TEEAKQAFAEFERKSLLETNRADNSNHELIFYYADYAEQPAKALEVAQREYARRHDVFTLDCYAWALHVNGQNEEAQNQINNALAVSIRDAKLFRHAGEISLAAGDRSAAESYLRQSAELNAAIGAGPGHPGTAYPIRSGAGYTTQKSSTLKNCAQFMTVRTRGNKMIARHWQRPQAGVSGDQPNGGRRFRRVSGYVYLLALLLLAATGRSQSQMASSRAVSGVVITDKNELVPGVRVVAEYASGKKETVTDSNGGFRLVVPSEPLTLKVTGKYVVIGEKHLSTSEPSEGLQLQLSYTIPPVHESMVISASGLNPTIDQRNDNVYK